ncbi:uncharacterized protein [Rutidosis leptorrhynchoides]|uniref:uncharacterized protein n=1 Tax=Rutidosis leptorrhynchoides TaxID=125765 RepID=UPI003A9A5148
MAYQSRLHPAFAVSNIKNHIPITLEINNSHYNTWFELFQITCRAYDVLDHLSPPSNSAESSTTTDPVTPPTVAQIALWSRLDAIFLNWLYGTISIELLNNIFEAGSTAAATWSRIKDIFQDNKSSRALYLQRQFNNIRLDNFPDVTSYCQKIKSIADQLSNVDDKVSDPRMVLQLIAGLNDTYDSIGSQLSYIQPLPMFYQARSMLLLEETRKQKQHIPSSTPSDVALLTTGKSSSQIPNLMPPNPNFTQPQSSYGNYNRGPGNNCGSYRGNYNNRGRSSNRGRGSRSYYPSYPRTWANQPPWAYQQPSNWAYPLTHTRLQAGPGNPHLNRAFGLSACSGPLCC